MQEWIKAAASNSQGNCVELRETPDGADLRDSKNPNGPIHHYSKAELDAFFKGVKGGEFDHLT